MIGRLRHLLAALALLLVCTPVDARGGLWKSWQKYQKKAYKMKRQFDEKMNKLSHDLYEGFPGFDFGHSSEKQKLCERYVNETRKELESAHGKTKERLSKAFDDITSYRHDLKECKQTSKQCQSKLDSEQLNLVEARSTVLQLREEVASCRARLHAVGSTSHAGDHKQKEVDALNKQVAALQDELKEARRLQGSETCRSAGQEEVEKTEGEEDSYRKYFHNGRHHQRHHHRHHRHHGNNGFNYQELFDEQQQPKQRGPKFLRCCFVRKVGLWALVALLLFGLKKYAPCCRRRRNKTAGEEAAHSESAPEEEVQRDSGIDAADEDVVVPPATFEYDAEEMSASNHSWQMVPHDLPASSALVQREEGAIEGARITPDGGEGEVGPTLSDSFCQRTGACLKSMHIPCPGIEHSGVTIYAKPNSAQVLFQRNACEGWEAKTWTYSYVIPHSEGSFTFQDVGLHMPKLEHGFLKVNFAPSNNPRSQVWNFPAHFYLDEDAITEVASAAGEEIPLLAVPAEREEEQVPAAAVEEPNQETEKEEQKSQMQESEEQQEQEQQEQQQQQQPELAASSQEVKPQEKEESEEEEEEEEEPEQEQEHQQQEEKPQSQAQSQAQSQVVQSESQSQSQSQALFQYFQSTWPSLVQPQVQAQAQLQAQIEEASDIEDAAADAMSVETDGRSDNSSEHATSDLESDSQAEEEEEDEEEDEEEEDQDEEENEEAEEVEQDGEQGLEQVSQGTATPRDVNAPEDSPRAAVVARQATSVSRGSSLDDEYVVC